MSQEADKYFHLSNVILAFNHCLDVVGKSNRAVSNDTLKRDAFVYDMCMQSFYKSIVPVRKSIQDYQKEQKINLEDD